MTTGVSKAEYSYLQVGFFSQHIIQEKNGKIIVYACDIYIKQSSTLFFFVETLVFVITYNLQQIFKIQIPFSIHTNCKTDFAFLVLAIFFLLRNV